MNGKELLDKMSEVDPKLIEGAEKPAEKPKSKRALFIGLSSGMAAVAAALAIVIGINASNASRISVNNNSLVDGIESLPFTNGGSGNEENSADKGAIDNASVSSTLGMQSPESVNITPEAVIDDAFAGFDDLPMISNQNYGLNGFGNGPTGSGVYSVYEGKEPNTLKTFSPWSLDAELSTLPVYLSNSTTPDVDKMRERVINAAAILGIPENELELKEDSGRILGTFDELREYMEKEGYPQEEIDREVNRLTRSTGAQTQIRGEASFVTIYCNTAGELELWYKEPYPIFPDGCSLDGDATPDERKAAAEYIAEEYKKLLGFKSPKIARYNGILEYNYYVYEGEGDLEAQIINYWLNHTSFTGENGLHILRLETLDNLEKLGDYPVYTAQEALWVMQSDRVPEEVRMPKDAEVVKVELEYSNMTGYTAVIPYYEFTVKTDEISEYSGELIYRQYKIPAVPEQFLDMTIEDYGVRA